MSFLLQILRHDMQENSRLQIPSSVQQLSPGIQNFPSVCAAWLSNYAAINRRQNGECSASCQTQHNFCTLTASLVAFLQHASTVMHPECVEPASTTAPRCLAVWLGAVPSHTHGQNHAFHRVSPGHVEFRACPLVWEIWVSPEASCPSHMEPQVR